MYKDYTICQDGNEESDWNFIINKIKISSLYKFLEVRKKTVSFFVPVIFR
jgi:hypothetical protein